MKDLTWDVLLATVKELAPTTTLEVKNALRQVGYWALQADVSAAMQQLVQQGELECYIYPDWQQYSALPYNIYQFPQAQTSPVVGQTASTTGTGLTIDDVKPVSQASSGDWVLFGYAGGLQIAVAGDVDRNVARAWYEREMNVPYAQIGCSRVR